jgi:hypothetical protein
MKEEKEKEEKGAASYLHNPGSLRVAQQLDHMPPEGRGQRLVHSCHRRELRDEVVSKRVPREGIQVGGKLIPRARHLGLGQSRQ